jgi:hypothetical protein
MFQMYKFSVEFKDLYFFVRFEKNPQAGSSLADFSTLKIQAIRSCETSVHTRSTRRLIPEDGILLLCFSLPSFLNSEF